MRRFSPLQGTGACDVEYIEEVEPGGAQAGEKRIGWELHCQVNDWNHQRRSCSPWWTAAVLWFQIRSNQLFTLVCWTFSWSELMRQPSEALLFTPRWHLHSEEDTSHQDLRGLGRRWFPTRPMCRSLHLIQMWDRDDGDTLFPQLAGTAAGSCSYTGAAANKITTWVGVSNTMIGLEYWHFN